jgi:hypothetical protein
LVDSVANPPDRQLDDGVAVGRIAMVGDGHVALLRQMAPVGRAERNGCHQPTEREMRIDLTGFGGVIVAHAQSVAADCRIRGADVKKMLNLPSGLGLSEQGAAEQ